MIPVDRVYQTVQDIINVEQRGQLPPSDFNNMASLAQLDLFKENFFDLAHFQTSRKQSKELITLLMRRIEIFETSKTLTKADGMFTLPGVDDDELAVYKLQNVYTTGNQEIELLSKQDIGYVMNSNALRPSSLFPKYERLDGGLVVYPDNVTSVKIYYVREPEYPEWVSMAIGDTGVPVFNSSASQDFELHPSQEDDLIKKILYYAGVSVRQADVSNAASGDLQQETAEERS